MAGPSPAIAAFVSAMDAFQVRQDAAVAGLQADIDGIKADLDALQNSPPVLDPGDQTMLDGIISKVSAFSDKLDAMDALTPPKTPPVTP